MESLAEKILHLLEAGDVGGGLDSLALSAKLQEDHQKLVGAVKSLEALGDVIRTEQTTSKQWELTEEGKNIAETGSHEAMVFNAVPAGADGISQPDLIKAVGAATGKVGLGKAMAAGWISSSKENGVALIRRKVESIEDKVKVDLALIKAGGKGAEGVADKAKAEYKKRKLVQEVVVKSYLINKGSAFTTKIEKAETDLTPEMIASGAWKTANFKPYNFQALGIQPPTGHLHPLLKVRAEYRQIFLEMGFSEMPTNNYVESSFWNFDALFQPQQHPARDAHDTFFISEPAEANDFPADYLEKVKTVHSVGGFGSQGYGYDWKGEEAKKNLLRTHTTAVSARMLYRVAQEYKEAGGEVFRPAKFFSIDRVFRNETLDATHLAEFHQIEGLVADRGLTLGDLIGIIYAFFKKLGIEKLRFKPAYNPYTEPSMEIFSYHEGLKKWVEIGNSGVFRPEMLLPMGLPEDVKVIAWGLSLERPTMIKYGIDNIRDLVGHKINLKMVQENPICRLDKDNRGPLSAFINMNEKRWESIEQKLQNIADRIAALNPSPMTSQQPQNSNDVIRDIVVSADPRNPPHSLKFYARTLSKKFPTFTSVHVHSSLKKIPGKSNNSQLLDFLSGCSNVEERSQAKYVITLIWKESSLLPSVTADPSKPAMIGEVNVGRLFARLIGGVDQSEAKQARLDEILDRIHGASEDPKAIGAMLKPLNGGGFLCGSEFTIADVHLLSLCQKNNVKSSGGDSYKKRCLAANPLLSMCC